MIYTSGTTGRPKGAARSVKENNIEDMIGLITFNSPDNRNSMDSETMPVFLEAIERVKEDSELRRLIITGTAKSFCAGADFRNSPIDMGGGLPHFAPFEMRILLSA